MPSPLLIGAAFVLAALALIPVLVTFGAQTLIAGAVMLGASYGWTRVPADTLAQQAVPDSYRGRVFAAVDLGYNTARVLGALAAVVVVPLLGPWTTIITIAVLFLVWAPIVPIWLRGEVCGCEQAKAPGRSSRGPAGHEHSPGGRRPAA